MVRRSAAHDLDADPKTLPRPVALEPAEPDYIGAHVRQWRIVIDCTTATTESPAAFDSNRLHPASARDTPAVSLALTAHSTRVYFKSERRPFQIWNGKRRREVMPWELTRR